MIARIAKLARREDRGATAVEYGLLVTFIALVMALGATELGTALQTMFHGAALKL